MSSTSESASNRIQSYRDFFPYYLREHREPTARALHYVGTTLSMGVLIAALATQTWWALPLVLIAGYGPAWVGHFFIEKNKPATFTYPLWSLRGDYHMFWLFLTGRLKARLKDAGAV